MNSCNINKMRQEKHQSNNNCTSDNNPTTLNQVALVLLFITH